MSVIEKSRKAIKEILGVKKRSDQYANYLATIDRLAKVRANLPGRISRTTSNYASAKIGSVGMYLILVLVCLEYYKHIKIVL